MFRCEMVIMFCRLLGRTEGRLGEKPRNQEFQKLRRHILWLPVRPLLSSEYSGVSIPGHTGMAPKPSQATDAQSQEETYRFCRQENIFQFNFFWFAWRAETEAYEYLYHVDFIYHFFKTEFSKLLLKFTFFSENTKNLTIFWKFLETMSISKVFSKNYSF